MPKLFVANATSQIRQFTYYLPRSTRHLMTEIQLGSQAQIPGPGQELSQPEIDGILAAHEVYGLISVQEALKARHFHGVVYSIDKPVSLPNLQELVNKYRGILHDRGRQLRQDAAIATNEYVEDQLFQNQMPGRLANLEVSVEEVDRDPRDESAEVSEGYRVRRDEGDRPPRVNRRRGSGR